MSVYLPHGVGAWGSNEIVGLVTFIFLIDLDYMQIYPLFILKEKVVCLITFSSHKHTNPPFIFTKNAEVS